MRRGPAGDRPESSVMVTVPVSVSGVEDGVATGRSRPRSSRVWAEVLAPTSYAWTAAGAAAMIRCSWMRIGTGLASSPPSELTEDELHIVMGRDGSSLESSRREASLPVRGPGSSAGEGAPGAAGAASDGAGIEGLRRRSEEHTSELRHGAVSYAVVT